MGTWKYLECLNCGLVSIFPRPDQHSLRENYDHYLASDPIKIRKWREMMGPIIRKSADLIESRASRRCGRILDIGCGYGFFLEEMRSRGWQVEGIEVSRTGRNYSREKFSIPVHESPLMELDLPGNCFDVVSLIYVIEHILNPVEQMREVNRILKPGGLVLVRWPHTTPLVKAVRPLVSIADADFYHTPYHIHDFSPSTMKRLLKYAGFVDSDTLPGGVSLPEGMAARLCSVFFGNLGEVLFQISGRKFLLPGISKTTLAVKNF